MVFCIVTIIFSLFVGIYCFWFGNSKTFADCEFTCCVLELALARSAFISLYKRRLLARLNLCITPDNNKFSYLSNTSVRSGNFSKSLF